MFTSFSPCNSTEPHRRLGRGPLHSLLPQQCYQEMAHVWRCQCGEPPRVCCSVPKCIHSPLLQRAVQQTADSRHAPSHTLAILNNAHVKNKCIFPSCLGWNGYRYLWFEHWNFIKIQVLLIVVIGSVKNIFHISLNHFNTKCQVVSQTKHRLVPCVLESGKPFPAIYCRWDCVRALSVGSVSTPPLSFLNAEVMDKKCEGRQHPPTPRRQEGHSPFPF